MKKIWLDITNTPQVHFLTAVYRALSDHGEYNCEITAREFSETAKLLQKNSEYPFRVIGGHYGKSYFRKIAGLGKRAFDVFRLDIDYDISLSCGSESAVWNAYLRRKKAITFGDNDLARQWTYGRFADFSFFPDAIDESRLIAQGISADRMYLYPGYKEDMYLADFKPDPEFPATLPFEEYVIVRPENIKANYIRNSGAKIITPELLLLLELKGINVLYLPRYEDDKAYASGLKNVFVPDEPVNGLDAVYYSNGVLTGAGTFAREAACLGVPSFSFFAGSDLLAVDKKLIDEGKMIYSRTPDVIVDKLMSSTKNDPDLLRSGRVRDEVIHKLKVVIETE